jgi:hypothetical protein
MAVVGVSDYPSANPAKWHKRGSNLMTFWGQLQALPFDGLKIMQGTFALKVDEYKQVKTLAR